GGDGRYCCHRTGRAIGLETHGNGANMDNLETREERRVMRRTCFSVEPGIYLPEFGIRSEVNVFVDAEGKVHVTGGKPQERVLPILAHVLYYCTPSHEDPLAAWRRIKTAITCY